VLRRLLPNRRPSAASRRGQATDSGRHRANVTTTHQRQSALHGEWSRPHPERSTDPKNSGVKTNAMIDDSGPELDAANVTPKILIAIYVVSRRLSNRRSHFMDGRVNISHGRRGIVDEQ
jgi:hypothetical protein